MSGPGDSTAGALGLLAAFGVLATAAVLVERQRAAQRAAGPSEVALHQAALTAVEQARAQIHVARRAADALREFSVAFDVKAKLASAFTEDLPAQPEAAAGKPDRRKLFFVVDGAEKLPALKQAVDDLLPGSPTSQRADEPVSARVALRQAIDADGGIWTAERALAVLEETGWRSDSERPLNVVGNLLAAMVRDGEIKRTGRGMYTSLRPAPTTDLGYSVAPGLFAREAAPGVLIISGVESPDDPSEAA
jgi:hypothetical protein